MRSLFIVALALAACNTPPAAAPARMPGALEGSGAVVMTVDGKPFHQNQLDAILATLPAQQIEMMKAQGQMGQLLDQVAMSDALYAKAIEAKMHEQAEVKLQLALAERQALAQAFVLKKADEAVTDESVKAWYDQRKVQFAKPEVKARHILVKEESKAQELKAQLDGGANFEELAKANSTDTGSAINGGDLGWFAKEKMVPAFADAAFAADVNAIVGPIETRFGFHIIQVTEKRDATPLEEVRDQAEEAIKQETLRAYTNELKAGLKIEKMGEYAEKTPPPLGGPHGAAQGLPPNHPPPAGKDDHEGHDH